jgi:hypothetical protein
MAAKKKSPSNKPPQKPASAPSSSSERNIGHPVFAEPQPTPDPTTFRIKHPSDSDAFKQIDELNKEHKLFPKKFPAPRGGKEPRLTLEDVFGGNTTAIQNITKNGQIVFHSTGDCGSTKGPKTQNEVTDKMVSDFNEAIPKDVPQFALLLGDVVYNFGETEFYFDQFYDNYRDYPAPILAVAGNHDGMVAPGVTTDTLVGFLANFCAEDFVVMPEAGGLSRTAQIQPGVFYTFEAPFVRILAIYSNTLEDPGVIADDNIGTSQLTFLEAALTRVKTEKYTGALLIADHHPPFTAAGSKHNSSSDMLKQIDQICDKVGVWPHAFLSGHSHNYQRFTRTRKDGTQIPYVVCGNGGHNAQPIKISGQTPRVPQIIQKAAAGVDQVVFENYDAAAGHFGYLRVVVSATQLRIEYHPASDGSTLKAPDDSVTIDLKTRTITHFDASDHGFPAAAAKIAAMRR